MLVEGAQKRAQTFDIGTKGADGAKLPDQQAHTGKDVAEGDAGAGESAKFHVVREKYRCGNGQRNERHHGVIAGGEKAHVAVDDHDHLEIFNRRNDIAQNLHLYPAFAAVEGDGLKIASYIGHRVAQVCLSFDVFEVERHEALAYPDRDQAAEQRIGYNGHGKRQRYRPEDTGKRANSNQRIADRN